jgi:pimeloyl-ACP methyl ester carboxylesterase
MRIDFHPRLRTVLAPLVVAGVAASILPMTAMAQSGSPAVAPSGINVVFVHGAWADGSSWSAEIEQLQAAGYNVRSVQLPLASLDEDAATVTRVLEQLNGPTIVVAHSYGGAVASQLSPDAPNVAALVFVDAFMLDEGESFQTLLGSQSPPWLANLHPDSAGYLSWDEEGFLQYFAPDVDPAQARVMWAAQKPINSAIFNEVGGPPSWKSIPSWYLIGDDDQVIPPAVQEQLATRGGSTIAHTPGSHVALVTHPDAVVDLVVGAIQTLGPAGSPAVSPAAS